MIWQVPELPASATKLDIYVGVALTLFVFDRVIYMVRQFMKKDNGKTSAPPGWFEVKNQVNEMHGWLSQEDPDTGVKVWRISAKELRDLQSVLDRLANALEVNSTVLKSIQQTLEDERMERRERRA